MQGGAKDSLTKPMFEETLLIDVQEEDANTQEEGQCPLFALVSLNAATAPSVEVPWSELLRLSLTPDKEPPLLTVGRAKHCSVPLSDPRASLNHFDIVARRCKSDSESETVRYDCFLNDLSSNGTSLNGKIVGKGQSQKLRSGDEICVLPAHKVGHEQRIAFVFRNASEMLATPKVIKPLDLDEVIICPICTEVIYKCVALMPCFHNFCMACFSDWMLKKAECPVCRQPTTVVMKNHAMDGVIEAFLEANPGQRRAKEEIEEMDARDRLKLCLGGKVVRDTCGVGTLPVAPLAAPPASQRVTQSAPTAPLSPPQAPEPPPPTIAPARPRRGATVCSLQ